MGDAFKQSLPAIVAAAALLLAPIAHAQMPDPADIAAGARLFRQKGNCQACHGWAGDGRKLDSQMPDGANLRESVLDRETLILLIKCGRPGTGMPPFDKFAYSDGRCYGLKQADVRSPKLQMPDPPATLQAREIDAIADFMFAKIIGKGPMDRPNASTIGGRTSKPATISRSKKSLGGGFRAKILRAFARVQQLGARDQFSANTKR